MWAGGVGSWCWSGRRERKRYPLSLAVHGPPDASHKRQRVSFPLRAPAYQDWASYSGGSAARNPAGSPVRLFPRSSSSVATPISDPREGGRDGRRESVGTLSRSVSSPPLGSLAHGTVHKLLDPLTTERFDASRRKCLHHKAFRLLGVPGTPRRRKCLPCRWL